MVDHNPNVQIEPHIKIRSKPEPSVGPKREPEKYASKNMDHNSGDAAPSVNRRRLSVLFMPELGPKTGSYSTSKGMPEDCWPIFLPCIMHFEEIFAVATWQRYGQIA